MPWNEFPRFPGVQYAAFAWGVPLTGNSWPDPVEVEGQPLVRKESDFRLSLATQVRDDRLFQKLMGMPLLDGRDFRPER